MHSHCSNKVRSIISLTAFKVHIKCNINPLLAADMIQTGLKWGSGAALPWSHAAGMDETLLLLYCIQIYFNL